MIYAPKSKKSSLIHSNACAVLAPKLLAKDHASSCSDENISLTSAPNCTISVLPTPHISPNSSTHTKFSNLCTIPLIESIAPFIHSCIFAIILFATPDRIVVIALPINVIELITTLDHH
jgi:hypothetical protein